MKKYRNQVVLLLTVMIWGSLYVAGRVVMVHIPALFLLFLRFSVSSVLLLGISKVKCPCRNGRLSHCPAGIRETEKIRREDWGEMLFVGFWGYFLSNAALLLGIQYSNASFSSLINALCPIFISLFAVLFLGEHIEKKDILSLAVAVAGATLIIGKPNGHVTGFGILCSVFSLIVWSYTMIHIKKLSRKYSPILVTGYGMGIAAVLSFPSALLFMKMTGASVEITPQILLPLLYVCVICTAVSHLMWNTALAKTDATKCAAYYPIQPLTSMVLGILLLHEEITLPFIAGAVMVLVAMVIHALPGASQ